MSPVENPWFLYFKNKAHSIENNAYENAINNFKEQKRNFLKQLEVQQKGVAKDFMAKLNESLSIEVENELDETFNEAYATIQEMIEEFLVGLVTGESQGVGQAELLQKFTSLIQKGQQGKINPDNLVKNMSNAIEKFLESNNFTRQSVAAKVASITGLKQTGNIDIQNNLFGYARALVLEWLSSGEIYYRINNYKTALKGYYKEELLVPALNSILTQYGVSARQAGSARNEKGQQIQYDILLGTAIGDLTDNELSSYIEQMEKLGNMATSQSVIMKDNVQLLGGIQSKSWMAPWSEGHGGNRYFLDFGSHSGFIPENNGKYYWHAGMLNAMQNLTTIIGKNNFIFSTGNQIYFTSELLTEFKAHSYVLAFSKPKDGPIKDGAVAMMPHTD